MKITFPDQTTNELNLFEASDKKAPLIIIFTAMGVKASYYRFYAQEMAASGIHVATIDQRGNETSSIRPSRKVNFGYREIVEVDYPHIITVLNEQFPESKKYIMGHSLGGQLASLFVSKYPSSVDGLILNASCSVYYKGWDGMQKLGVYCGAKLCQLIANTLGYYPGKILGFGGLEAKGIINDWHYTAITGEYKANGSTFNYEEALKNVTLPVMAISYEGDSAAPKRSLDNLCDKFGEKADVTRLHLQHENHPHKKFSHYSWVKTPGLTTSLVKDWITKPPKTG